MRIEAKWLVGLLVGTGAVTWAGKSLWDHFWRSYDDEMAMVAVKAQLVAEEELWADTKAAVEEGEIDRHAIMAQLNALTRRRGRIVVGNFGRDDETILLNSQGPADLFLNHKEIRMIVETEMGPRSIKLRVLEDGSPMGRSGPMAAISLAAAAELGLVRGVEYANVDLMPESAH